MLSKFSVKRPYTVIVAIIIIAVLGVVSYLNMTTDLMPSMNMPYAVITTAYVGASPEEVEEVVTKTIEQSMTSISNIKNVSSTSSENISAVVLEFNQSTNMDSAMIEMREKLDMLSAMMPDGVQPSTIMKINPSMMPVMAVAVSVDKQHDAEYGVDFIKNKIIPEIESTAGIATVSANGLTEYFVNIVIDEEKLADKNAELSNIMMDQMVDAYIAQMQAQGLPLPEIEDAAQMYALIPPEMAAQVKDIVITNEMIEGLLQGQNFSMPTGNITDKATTFLVKTGDKIKSVDELKNMLIASVPLPSGEEFELRISDVADVLSLDTSGDSYAKVNGEQGLLLTLSKQADFSTAEITKSATAKFEQLKETYPGVSFSTLMDQGDYVNIMISAIFQNIIIGAILAALVLLLFLKSFRSTFVIALSIIVSVVTAYVLMYFSGITLNVISMGGLALGIGMLVDNSIVVIENIYRMRNEGMSAISAAIEGAKQVSGAIVASTITTIIVFVPILFTEGFTRQIFTDMGLTITFSLVASLLVALTLVPTAAATVLAKKPIKVNKSFEKVKNGYAKLLGYTLKHKWAVYILVVALLGASVLSATQLGSELIPETDMGNFMVTIDMPKEKDKDEIFKELDDTTAIIAGIDGVKTVGAMYGGASSGGGMMSMMGGSGNQAMMYVLLDEDRSNKITTSSVGKEIRDLTADKDYELTVSATGADLSALTGGAVVINVYSRELDDLNEYANLVADKIGKVEGVIEIDNGLGVQTDELRITVNKDKAMAKGIAVAQVFSEVNKLINHGDVATSITENGVDYDIYVDKEGSAVTITDIEKHIIKGTMGEVAVKDIASVEKSKGMQSISRDNGSRYVSVTASIDNGYIAGDVNAEISKLIKDIDVKNGVEITQVGQNEMMNQTFKDLTLMLILAILFIYLVMVAQFQSLLSPFIVMFTIPLAFTGGFFAQFITGTPISAISLIGMVLLVGIVVNNGIVFVDYTNKLIKDEGMPLRDALVKAGKDRIRPILLTALTTVFAQLALCLDTSTAASLTRAMAITAIGGLTYATILTLFLVPALYESFHKNDAKRAEKKLLKQSAK